MNNISVTEFVYIACTARGGVPTNNSIDSVGGIIGMREFVCHPLYIDELLM